MRINCNNLPDKEHLNLMDICRRVVWARIEERDPKMTINLYVDRLGERDPEKMVDCDGNELFFNGWVVCRDRHEKIFDIHIQNKEIKHATKTLIHEMIHVVQMYSNDLIIYEDGMIEWKGTEYDPDKIIYEDRPWEQDAIENTPKMIKVVKESRQSASNHDASNSSCTVSCDAVFPRNTNCVLDTFSLS